jgi:hypothetical protein
MLVQLSVGWYGASAALPHLPDLKKLNLFIAAAVVAAIVWLVGAIASLALKDVARPTPGALLYTFAVAVILAAIPFIPDAERAVESVIGPLPNLVYPLVGAVVGYAIQR